MSWQQQQQQQQQQRRRPPVIENVELLRPTKEPQPHHRHRRTSSRNEPLAPLLQHDATGYGSYGALEGYPYHHHHHYYPYSPAAGVNYQEHPMYAYVSATQQPQQMSPSGSASAPKNNPYYAYRTPPSQPPVMYIPLNSSYSQSFSSPHDAAYSGASAFQSPPPTPHNSTALSMDDIEQAFHTALDAHQTHPLKKNSNNHNHNKKASTVPHPRKVPSYGATGIIPPSTPPYHRRAYSDTPHNHEYAHQQQQQQHRRAGSDASQSATKLASRSRTTDSLEWRKWYKDDYIRRRHSFSSLDGLPRAHHRRGNSSSAVSSVATDTSRMSMVSDIRQSRFFGGYNEQGNVELQFPISRTHLVMMNPHLQVGRIYAVPIAKAAYEEYHHQIADDSSLGGGGGLGNNHHCGCPCAHCVSCHGGKTMDGLLPPNYYALAVPDDLYRRVVDEMCAARTMPCGLFFCGHHEDVSRPSIWIAVMVVGLLLGGMATLAFVLHYQE